MINHIRRFCLDYEYPQSSADVLIEAYGKMKGDNEFFSLIDVFYTHSRPDSPTVTKLIEEAAERTSVDPLAAKLLFYICLVPDLQKQYEKYGIDLDIMHDSLKGLRCKLYECMEVNGVTGTCSPGWFYNIFTMKVFKLGRMEFCIEPYHSVPVTIGDYAVNTGDDVISVHIPSTGEKFDKAARLDSYDRAYRFFRDVMGKDVKTFFCGTWLLYPDNKKILPETSNIVSFMDDFRILLKGEYHDEGVLWRIFGADANKPYNELPRNTSLRRAFADWLSAGNRMGRGEGVFVWDTLNKCTIT